MWFKNEKNNAHSDIFQVIKNLETIQNGRNSADIHHLRLYGNYNHIGLNFANYSKQMDSSRLTLNVIQSCCDTATNKIAKNKPKIKVITTGGTSSQQKQAKNLSKFINGMFVETNLYEKKQDSFLDATIWGTGILKVFEKNGRPVVEKVFPFELVVDDNQSMYSDPMELHQKKWVDKEVLKEMFPKKTQEIESVVKNGSSYSRPIQTISSLSTEQVLVVESWRLPNSRGQNGRHVICIENTTLIDEEYKKKYFPFVFDYWNKKRMGLFGQGIAEQINGIQVSINKHLKTIDESLKFAVPRVFLEKGSKTPIAHINDKIGAIIEWEKSKPDFHMAQVVSPELMNHVERFYMKAFEMTGLSQLSAQSKKPAGLDSGKALREFNDIESERFNLTGQRYENTFITIAKMFIDIAKEIVEKYGEFKVKLKGKNFVETIDWKEVKIDEDQFILEILPVSALSGTFSGRIQDVKDLIALGGISKEDALMLLDFPDLEQNNNLDLASVRDIHDTIEMIVEDGKLDISPEPYQNLVYGIPKMQFAYLYYKNRGLDEDRLQAMRDWISSAKLLIDKAQEQAQNNAKVIQSQNGEIRSFNQGQQ